MLSFEKVVTNSQHDQVTRATTANDANRTKDEQPNHNKPESNLDE